MSDARYQRLFTTLLFLCAIIGARADLLDDDISDIVEECVQKCPFQNRTDDGHYDFGCGGECGVEQLCNYGCTLWEEALKSSCQDVCNVTSDVVPVKELYCVMGCNGALNHYFLRLRDKIVTPPPPALVADSLTSTSLSLEWEGSRHSNLSYLVQWRYEEVAGAWQYCRNQTWGSKSVVRVENLQPFTKYRFRIAVLLSPRHSDPIVSAPSVVITTLPLGPPSSPPGELRVTAVDSHRISLSWEPGPFPNGHILSYVLKISEIPSGYSALKDLAVSENSLFYMFQSLAPSVSYRVSVAMRNAVGEGPSANVTVTTPALPTATANQQPILILGGKYTVVQQPADILDEPKIIYNTSNVIQGVGIDVGRDLLFVSDSSGSIYKSSLSRISPSEAIITPSSIPYTPLSLSVDWLNGHLYILGEVNHNKDISRRGNMNNIVRWQIMRSDFDGKSQTVAFAGFHSKPVHIEVDPYNGYLFWALHGPSGGLYRLDLADISNGVKHDVIPEQILKDNNLGAFTVDHTNFRILVAHHSRNTILAVSLDGREVTDFRMNTQNAIFFSVQSLSYANGLFHWTNGKDVLTEEYNSGQDSYFHNKYPDFIGMSFNSVLVAIRSSQPIPVAVNPPTSVQSVMGEHRACVNWRAPHRLGPQGAGAWQRWAYTLQISEVTNNTTLFKIDVNDTTSYTINNLKENTEYVIKVAAVTSSGTGPWSSEFIATTLSPLRSGVHRSMFWSASEGVMRSDLTGNNVQTLIHKSQLHGMHIVDISWYKDLLYLVANSSNVMWYNTTSNESGWIPDMDNVGSLAVDWIGRKLYWSSPKQQLITRGNLRGGSREPVPIVTVGKELRVDSLKGYIYWNTGHAVECSRLNGEHKFTYYPAQLFRKQVMGLTLDLDNRLLYWIVHGYEGTHLHKAPTADTIAPGTEMSASLVTSLSGSTMLGPSLSYFSSRLMWLQDNTHAVIADLKGQNRANLNAVTMAHVYMITVMDPDLQTYPEGVDSIEVIPEAVDHDSIQISGNWDSYYLTWQPVTRVNYGQVFYEIKIEYDRRIHKEYTTTEPAVKYFGEEVPPYSTVEMSVRAYTYWGAALATRASLRSPQALPSPPTSSRVFVVHQTDILSNDTEVSLIFRWNRPLYPNGVVRGYLVEFCHFETLCETSGNLSNQQMEHIVRGVLWNVTYTFQVQAFTDAGYGPQTRKIETNTINEKPVPKLAISYFNSIKVADLDLGDGLKYTVSRSSGKPEDFAVSLREGLLFWINQEQEVYLSRMEETGHNKVLSINGTALSITVDWVSRMMYWSQIENTPDPYECILYRMDLNVYDKEGTVKLYRVLQRNMYIKKLQISPLTRSLYWIEVNHHGLGKLMTSDVDGSNIRPFFSGNYDVDKKNITKPCNCPENPAVGLGFTLDLTNTDDMKIIWVDAWLKHITQSDLSGCYCKVIVNATKHNNKALPPSSVTVDSKNIYWMNSTSNQLYFVNKATGNIRTIDHINITSGLKISAIGNHIQPYPSRDCLYPKQSSLTVGLVSKTSTSLTLNLPYVLKHERCDGFIMSTPYYTILYQPYVEGDKYPCLETTCTTIKTFSNTHVLDGLRPFSKYVFLVEVNNYYGDWSDIIPVRGPPVVLQTTAGAPQPASDVRAQVLSPHRAKVEWSPSTHTTASTYGDLIGPDLWYEVHWRTEGSFTPNQGIEEHKFIPKTKSPLNQTTAVADLQKLMPAQSYSVWVRTYSLDSVTYTDSESITIQTYPEPNNVKLEFRGPYMIHVSWLPYKKVKITLYNIEYAEVGLDTWTPVEDEGSQKSDGSINYVVQNLLPKTQYKFRLKIFYPNSSLPYIWPKDSPFTFETLGDRPSPPGKPIVLHVTGAVYHLQWTQSNPNGSPISLYRLYGDIKSSEDDPTRVPRDVTNVNNINLVTVALDRITREANHSQLHSDVKQFSVEDNMQSMVVEEDNSDDNVPKGWTLLYNGTKNYWIITELKLTERYKFYVQAENEYGWSDFSEPSDEFDFSEAKLIPAQTDYFYILLGIGLFFLGVSIIGLGLCACVLKKQDKKVALTQMAHIPHGHDVELANLRELPRSRGGGGMFQRSPIYQPGGPMECDVAQLSHIRRDQITLTKFLGSGAFGEVFEGKAKGLGEEGSCTKVAVKTLRKGATDHEKFEFLQEAQLMSNFKHQHILSLLGVCIDNDPHFIIMELMEAGDLLSYLRTRRPMLYTNDSLTLRDLLSMCLDVTRGCCYLEELHFVHRDLAARNCLVSQQPTGRIVKIGDFGLARDIYKNDYYRKEGEGLLPVRWMAVECLTDGVFSRASDVWAWAVLCWEVAALGRQPYPALSNHAVMRYVRAGGTLPRPPNCPLSLFQLMQTCWSYNPDHRPTFKHCLEVLEDLMETIEDTVITDSITEEPQYITAVPEGFTNQTYFIGVNQTAYCTDDMDFLHSNSGMLCNPENQEATTSEGIPKYLELIYGDEPVGQLDFEGYEVPRTSIRSNTPMFAGDGIERRLSLNRMDEQRRSLNRMDEQRRSLNRMYYRHSYKVPKRNASYPIQRARSFNSPTATAQIHAPNGFKVKVLESSLNGVVYHNSCMQPRCSKSLQNSNLNPRVVSQKIIPINTTANIMSRSNSLSSRTSEDDRVTALAQSEQKRLLNNNNTFTQSASSSLNGAVDLNK